MAHSACRMWSPGQGPAESGLLLVPRRELIKTEFTLTAPVHGATVTRLMKTEFIAEPFSSDYCTQITVILVDRVVWHTVAGNIHLRPHGYHYSQTLRRRVAVGLTVGSTVGLTVGSPTDVCMSRAWVDTVPDTCMLPCAIIPVRCFSRSRTTIADARR